MTITELGAVIEKITNGTFYAMVNRGEVVRADGVAHVKGSKYKGHKYVLADVVDLEPKPEPAPL